MGMPVLLAPVSLWLLWHRSPDPEAAATVAALIGGFCITPRNGALGFT